jgi:hypothetical protein
MFGSKDMVEPDLFGIPLTPGPLPRTWECCIADVDGRQVERWRPNDASPETLTDALAWQPDRFTEPHCCFPTQW